MAVRKVYKSTIAQFFELLIKILVSASLLNLFWSKGKNYACFSLILGDVISEIFSFFLNFLLYKSDIKIYKTTYNINYSSKFYNKKIFKISIPIAITSFIRSGLSTVKQTIIPLSFEKGNLACSKSLSIYGEINGMAMPIVLFPHLFFSSVSSLLIPEFSAYNTTKQIDMIRKITKKILVISTLFSFILFSLLFCFATPLSNLIYKSSNISFYIKTLSPILIFVLLDCVIDNILKGLDAQNNVMFINILDLIINIIIIRTIIPKFGVHGYIFSMYFSEIFNLILSLRKLFNIISR